MSRFVTQETQTLDVGDGEWMKVPKALSYAEVMKYSSCGNTYEISKAMMVGCIKEWNLKLKEGSDEIAPLTEENILNLDIKTSKIISDALTLLMEFDDEKSDAHKKK